MAKKDSNLIDDLAISVPEQNYEIVDADTIEEFSIAHYKREQEALATKRKQLALKLDGERLKQANQVMGSMSMILDRLMDGYDRDVPAKDIKDLAEAYEKMARTFNTVFRLDSIDGQGTAGEITLKFNFY